MLELFNTQIESLSIHQVGNMQKGENLFLSQQPYTLDDQITSVLKEYFLKPFREKEENFMRFVNETSLEFNEMFAIVTEIFENPSTIHTLSLRIAQLLYEQSNHPHIKSGELYVAYLTHVTLDNTKVEAIGIFKSEMKQNFLQFEQGQNQLDILLEEGVNVNKLDKGCLIFNVNEEEGYKILSVDSNRYDTKYWTEQFLGIDALADDAFFTKKYLKMCQDFAKEVVLPAEGKQEEILFMNRAVNHFAKNDEFEETHFLNEVLGDKVFKKEYAAHEDDEDQSPKQGYMDLIPEFHNFKETKGKKYYIEDVSSFPIVNKAVSDMRKKIKNIIDLDTNIQIRMDFINPESAEKFVEKGWDEERGMFYYLIYFNEEKKS
ncbi:nucleoid-associated protein [Capnocytophaga gingivalis]|uniref:Nucleoid-associated protein n=1 Tax=Capnocytophaga gingivalis TaxID=1017 RepID=A0ABU5Y6Z1_9FLAO|nr:nucleoid-associated protein [Capnocytophaga gingivalis]MEB3039693.1 nucleoid-associated protein [Capnocytophaga gingivalis]